MPARHALEEILVVRVLAGAGQPVALLARAALARAEVADRLDERAALVGELHGRHG